MADQNVKSQFESLSELSWLSKIKALFRLGQSAAGHATVTDARHSGKSILVLEAFESDFGSKELVYLIDSCLEDYDGKIETQDQDSMTIAFSDAKRGLQSAVSIRRRFNELNTKRVVQGKRILRVSMGMSLVTSVDFKAQALQAALAVAKWSKEHHVELACEESFYLALNQAGNSRPLDCIAILPNQGTSVIYELFDHSAKSVRDYKTSTKLRMESFLEAKQKGNYELALSLMEQMIHDCPKHTYLSDQLMDSTLLSLKQELKKSNSYENQKQEKKAA